MEFEWDSSKNEANRAKHKVSFTFATAVFDDPNALRVEVSRVANGKQRWKAIGLIDNRLFTVVFTVRDGRVRIISARRANRSEDLRNVAHNDNPEAIRFVLEEDRSGRHIGWTNEQRLSLLIGRARLGEAGPDERTRAMRLALEAPLATVAAARAHAARELEPEYERWRAYRTRLRGLGAAAAPPGSPRFP